MGYTTVSGSSNWAWRRTWVGYADLGSDSEACEEGECVEWYPEGEDVGIGIG
jgi:hypothetical protein